MLQTLWFVVETVASMLSAACLLRGYMNWRGLGARDPIGQFLIAATDWLVRPLRRMLPRPRRLDWGSFVAAALVALVLGLFYVLVFANGRIPAFGVVVLLAAFWLIKWSLYLVMGAVLLGAILSWVNPFAPIRPTIDALIQPVLDPVRRIVPLLGGVDLSPLVVLIVAQVLLSALHAALPALVSLHA